MKRITHAGVAQSVANGLLCALYATFLWVHAVPFIERPRASYVLFVAMEAIVVVIALVRRPADRTSWSPYAWATTLGGMATPFLMRPVVTAHDVWIGQALQVLGATVGVLGILSLNRSFGLLPAHRGGIRSTGMYRWVRHPLYASYAVIQLGYLINNPSLKNAAICGLAVAFQILRLLNEERFLSNYPEYARYKVETPWRLFPHVF